MHWLRGIDALASSSSVGITEAELGSEARIVGQLEYANGAILLRPLTYEPDSKGLLKYVLRVRHPSDLDLAGQQSGTRHGYLFPGGPLGELIALSSLKLRARLFLLSTTLRQAGDDVPIIKVEYAALSERVNPHFDTVVFDNSTRDVATDVGTLLEEVTQIPAQYHLELAVAAGRYAHALTAIGEDEELVFVHLVSAIERLARDQPIRGDLISGRTVDDLLRTDLLGSEEIEEIEQLLAVRKCKQRFVAFVQQYSLGFFEGEEREPSHTQVTPENLAAVAGAIYDARSGYLHNGDPMYLSSPSQARPGRHMDATVGLRWQDRRFRREQKLPFGSFFHRLVRHCILARMAELRRVSG